MESLAEVPVDFAQEKQFNNLTETIQGYPNGPSREQHYARRFPSGFLPKAVSRCISETEEPLHLPDSHSHIV